MWNLYHRIADPNSGRVRSEIISRGFGDRARFRNVDTGPEALADLKRLTGGDRVPCLEVDARVYQGVEEILNFLAQEASKADL